jgi:hypothetical protein
MDDKFTKEESEQAYELLDDIRNDTGVAISIVIDSKLGGKDRVRSRVQSIMDALSELQEVLK